MSAPTDLPATIATSVAGRSFFQAAVATPVKFVRPSIRHGRSLAAPLEDRRWLAIKGCGWTLGPPWVVMSPKDAELCFGLFDQCAAIREVEVSRWLQEHEIYAARSVEWLLLERGEIELLGADATISFNNGESVAPAALLTISASPFRVMDLLSESGKEAIADMRRIFARDASEDILDAFAARLLGAIIAYQKLGAVNDTLGTENVVVSGEIIDFEWFSVPGIPLPDGSADAILVQRQRKEAFYFLDTMIAVSTALGLNHGIGELARRCLLTKVSDGLAEPPVLLQLRDLATTPR